MFRGVADVVEEVSRIVVEFDYDGVAVLSLGFEITFFDCSF